MKSNSDELEKRVTILQGKLDKQKQLTREYEVALKSQKPQVGGASWMGQPLVDSKVRGCSVQCFNQFLMAQQNQVTVIDLLQPRTFTYM